MQLVDTHSHFDVGAYDGDRAAAHARAMAAGVTRQLVPAIDAAGWPNLKQVCAQWPGLYPAYGLHPMFVEAHRPQHLAELRLWIECERPLAIGECGLDFFVEGLDATTQQIYFDSQLRLARDFELPLIIHARRAVDAVISSVRRIGGLRGVIHSFPGSKQQAAQLHGLGFLLGIGGPVTYERANKLRQVVATVPLEQLLLETDSPDQPGASHRGQRNEPANLVEVLDVVATLRGTTREELAAATTANAQQLFGFGT